VIGACHCQHRLVTLGTLTIPLDSLTIVGLMLPQAILWIVVPALDDGACGKAAGGTSSRITERTDRWPSVILAEEGYR
jgi:hypothetical protein